MCDGSTIGGIIGFIIVIAFIRGLYESNPLCWGILIINVIFILLDRISWACANSYSTRDETSGASLINPVQPPSYYSISSPSRSSEPTPPTLRPQRPTAAMYAPPSSAQGATNFVSIIRETHKKPIVGRYTIDPSLKIPISPFGVPDGYGKQNLTVAHTGVGDIDIVVKLVDSQKRSRLFAKDQDPTTIDLSTISGSISAKVHVDDGRRPGFTLTVDSRGGSSTAKLQIPLSFVGFLTIKGHAHLSAQIQNRALTLGDTEGGKSLFIGSLPPADSSKGDNHVWKGDSVLATGSHVYIQYVDEPTD